MEGGRIVTLLLFPFLFWGAFIFASILCFLSRGAGGFALQNIPGQAERFVICHECGVVLQSIAGFLLYSGNFCLDFPEHFIFCRADACGCSLNIGQFGGFVHIFGGHHEEEYLFDGGSLEIIADAKGKTPCHEEGENRARYPDAGLDDLHQAGFFEVLVLAPHFQIGYGQRRYAAPGPDDCPVENPGQQRGQKQGKDDT